jgi:hypothetical protein
MAGKEPRTQKSQDLTILCGFATRRKIWPTAVNVYHVISRIASRLGNGLPTPAALTIPAFALARLVPSSDAISAFLLVKDQ